MHVKGLLINLSLFAAANWHNATFLTKQLNVLGIFLTHS